MKLQNIIDRIASLEAQLAEAKKLNGITGRATTIPALAECTNCGEGYGYHSATVENHCPTSKNGCWTGFSEGRFEHDCSKKAADHLICPTCEKRVCEDIDHHITMPSLCTHKSPKALICAECLKEAAKQPCRSEEKNKRRNEAMSRSKTINSIITTQNIDYKNTFTSREKTICELIGKKCYDAGFNEGATREHISCMKRYAKGLKHTSESCNFKYDENCIACNWEADLNKAINALHPAKDEKVKE